MRQSKTSLALATVITLQTASMQAYAQSIEKSNSPQQVTQSLKAQKLSELLKLQTEMTNLQIQIVEKKKEIQSTQIKKNISIIISAASAAVMLYSWKKMNSPVVDISQLGPYISSMLLGGAGVVTSVSIGGYEHYKLSLSEKQLLKLEARITAIQIKIDQKIKNLEL